MIFKEGNIFINKILELLIQKRNFDFKGHNASFVERRIDKRIATTQAKNIQAYLELLQENEIEIDHLIDVLTINYSQFFRDSFTFEYFATVFIPALVTQKLQTNNPSIRVWSAGCAAGEEPYSLAILFNEYLKKEDILCDVKIFATDIDKKILEAAKKGSYKEAQIANVKYAYLKKYFTREKNNFMLHDDIKKMVDFSFHNVLSKEYQVPEASIFGNFDVVFCRNVLIYFNTSQQEIINSKLYNSLNKTGLLVLGRSEALVDTVKSSMKNITNFGKNYQKN